MPNFVQPPAITNYMLETCEDACQIIVSFQDMINSFNQALTDLYTWFNSSSFPNVIYNADDGKFYYYADGAFQEIPHMPNVSFDGTKLVYRVGLNTFDVPASSLKNAVFFDGSKQEYFRRMGSSGDEAVYPYLGCMRYDGDLKAWHYYDGTTWQVINLIPNHGALFWNGTALKQYNSSTNSYDDFTLPYFEGQVRAKADDSGLEVYRAGSWLHLYTFP